jgi:D-tyrosyl-tRNA(Tyr) deacylase
MTPITLIKASSKIKPRDSSTTPKDGNVSRPEKGGAKNAKTTKISITLPMTLEYVALF